jgi:hypothetical protein
MHHVESFNIPVKNADMAIPPKEHQRPKESPCLPLFGGGHREAMAEDEARKGSSGDAVELMGSSPIDVVFGGAVRPMAEIRMNA